MQVRRGRRTRAFVAGIAVMIHAPDSAVTRQYTKANEPEERVQGTSTAPKPGNQRAPSWNVTSYNSTQLPSERAKSKGCNFCETLLASSGYFRCRVPSWNVAPYDSSLGKASEEELNDISNAIWLSFQDDRYGHAMTNFQPKNADEWKNYRRQCSELSHFEFMNKTLH